MCRWDTVLASESLLNPAHGVSGLARKIRIAKVWERPAWGFCWLVNAVADLLAIPRHQTQTLNVADIIIKPTTAVGLMLAPFDNRLLDLELAAIAHRFGKVDHREVRYVQGRERMDAIFHGPTLLTIHRSWNRASICVAVTNLPPGSRRVSIIDLGTLVSL